MRTIFGQMSAIATTQGFNSLLYISLKEGDGKFNYLPINPSNYSDFFVQAGATNYCIGQKLRQSHNNRAALFRECSGNDRN